MIVNVTNPETNTNATDWKSGFSDKIDLKKTSDDIKAEAWALQWEVTAQQDSLKAQNDLKKQIPQQPEQEKTKTEQQQMIEHLIVLISQYENLLSDIHSKEGNNGTKHQLQYQLTQNINDLKSIQNDLQNHTYNNLNTYKARIWELEYFLSHYENVRQIITLWWKTSDIHAIIDSKSDAKHAQRYERRDAKSQQQMNTLLKDTAITSLWNNDMERYEEYLEMVVNWIVEPSTHPFYTAHKQSFNMIQNINPTLYWTLVPHDKNNRISCVTYCQNLNTWTQSVPYITYENKSFNQKIWEWFANTLEKRWALSGDPRQKEARTKAWSAIAIWWAILCWVKILKNLFSSKESNPNKRWKTLLRWWSLLALFNWDKIVKWWKNRFQDAFNWHPAEKTKMIAESFQTYWFADTDAIKIADKYVWAPVATMSALHFIPIYELTNQKIIEYNEWKFHLNLDNYNKYIDQYNWNDDQKKIVKESAQKLNDENSISDWLKAFWIKTENDLQQITWNDKTKTLAQTDEVKKWYQQCVERLSHWVNTKLYNEWLRAKDTESLDKIIAEYDNNKWEKTANELIIKWLQEWLLAPKDTNKQYSIENIMQYSKELNANLENKTIEDLHINFDTYEEMFDIINLTNFIKENFKWKEAKSENPFHIAPEKLWRIEFDNTQRYEIRKNETDVIKAPTLKSFLDKKEKREEYVKYLNLKWNYEQKNS